MVADDGQGVGRRRSGVSHLVLRYALAENRGQQWLSRLYPGAAAYLRWCWSIV